MLDFNGIDRIVENFSKDVYVKVGEADGWFSANVLLLAKEIVDSGEWFKVSDLDLDDQQDYLMHLLDKRFGEKLFQNNSDQC